MSRSAPRTVPHLRNRYLLLSDAVLFTVSLGLAFTLRYEALEWPPGQGRTFLLLVAIFVPIKLALLYAVGLYRRLWSFAGVAELERIIVGGILVAVVTGMLGAWILPVAGLLNPRPALGVLAFDAFLTSAFLAAPRLLARILHRRAATGVYAGAKRVLIAGAGSSGEILVRQLRTNPQLGLLPIGFLDDDEKKQGLVMQDLPVFGAISQLRQIAREEQAREVIIAMPSAPGTVIRRVLDLAREAGLETRTMAGVTESLSGRAGASILRPVRIEDVLRREAVRTNLERVREFVQGATVLVTGAGGSIGSELCRQISSLGPARLLLLGHAENDIFEIHEELRERHPSIQLVPLIADVRDRKRIDRLLRGSPPTTIFHAAAHKHVPLMEENIADAITNNVLGTLNVAELAVELGTRHMVLVSTDKAVRPTNVMGATKRVAEQVVQELSTPHERHFIAVRFGNVLGSRGSVIPSFLAQIAAGGPVRVTHPEMRRFFMTIPESVQLVLQAAALGRGGEVFVLDMGEPVRILDLARDLIRLSGLEEGKDIQIHFSGVRPGEKLYEELFFGAEVAAPTEHPKILKARHAEIQEPVMPAVAALIEAARAGAPDEVLLAWLRKLVPDYDPAKSPHNITGRMQDKATPRLTEAPPVPPAT
ncbi:MAG: polysaccharide biosynthesis protein [Gemmatimonadales bacterium]